HHPAPRRRGPPPAAARTDRQRPRARTALVRAAARPGCRGLQEGRRAGGRGVSQGAARDHRRRGGSPAFRASAVASSAFPDAPPPLPSPACGGGFLEGEALSLPPQAEEGWGGG